MRLTVTQMEVAEAGPDYMDWLIDRLTSFVEKYGAHRVKNAEITRTSDCDAWATYYDLHFMSAAWTGRA